MLKVWRILIDVLTKFGQSLMLSTDVATLWAKLDLWTVQRQHLALLQHLVWCQIMTDPWDLKLLEVGLDSSAVCVHTRSGGSAEPRRWNKSPTDSWSWALLSSRQLCSYSSTSQNFMELEVSVPCSQEPSTDSHPKPDQSGPYHLILSL
jgi:hypothetical protein